MSLLQRSVLLLLLLILLGSWYQNAVILDGGYRAATRYPPDFPQINRPVSAHFSADSARADSLLGVMWKNYNFSQWDSLLLSSQATIRLTEDLVQQKFDSAVYEYWLLGYLAQGQSMVYLGDIRQGSEIMNEALAIRKRVFGDNFSLAIEYYGLGHMAIDLFNDPDLALDYYRLGEATARKSLPPGHPELANCYRNLGLGYWLKGDYSTALRYYERVMHLDNLLPVQRLKLYNHIGERYAEIGDLDNALHYYLLGRGIEGGETHLMYRRELAIGQIYLEQGKPHDCAVQIAHCEALLHRSGNELRSQGLHTGLIQLKADWFFYKKNFPKAILLLKAAISASEKSNGGPYSLNTLELWQQLASCQLAAGQLPAAETSLRELLWRETRQSPEGDFAVNPACTQFTRQPYHLRTLELKGRYFEAEYARTGQDQSLKKALASYLLADSLVDRIRDTYRGIGSKNQLAGSARPVYQHAIDCCYTLWQKSGDVRYLETAWRLMEKSKSLDVLESLRETEARQLTDIRPEDLQQEKNLKKNLNYYEQLIFDERLKPAPDSFRISQWHREVAALKTAQDSLVAVFRSRYPEYYRLKYNRKLASIAEVQGKLSEGAAMVAYFKGDSVLFSCLIDRGQCRLFRQTIDSAFLPDIQALRTDVHYFDPQLPRSDAEKAMEFRSFTGAASRLYGYLLQQPLAATRAGELVVVPDDVIGYVPFAALLQRPVAPDAAVSYRDLPYLLRSMTIRQEYSGTVFAESKPGNRSGPYLGLAPGYPGSALAARELSDSLRFARVFGDLRGGEIPALRYNKEEVGLAQTTMGGEAKMEQDATEIFFRQYAPRASVLHLAMHALTNDSDPLFSTLVFAGARADSTGENDGMLHAYELYDLRLNADLAVLSACNTGAGRMVRGEGIMSLARAFRYAGCPNVMMSLCPVNDLSARNLVSNYFNRLHEGLGKADALRAAQLDFLAQTKSDELMHPYYWAGFMLVGNNEPVGNRPSTPFWYWAAALTVAVAGGLLVWKRYRPSSLV